VTNIINQTRTDRGEGPMTTRQVLGFETVGVAPHPMKVKVMKMRIWI